MHHSQYTFSIITRRRRHSDITPMEWHTPDIYMLLRGRGRGSLVETMRSARIAVSGNLGVSDPYHVNLLFQFHGSART